MEICSVRHSSDLFSVYRNHNGIAGKNELVAYVSDLEANNPIKCVWGQVYDDACDRGFVIISVKTGKEAVFARDSVIADSDGEVQAWRCIPTRDTLRRLPQLKGWTITLIND
jgi:hypothetical protein